MNSRVTVYTSLNEYQQELLKKGHPRLWMAVDENQENLFTSIDKTEVIKFSNKNLKVSYITSCIEF